MAGVSLTTPLHLNAVKPVVVVPYVPWPANHGGRQRSLECLRGLKGAGLSPTVACIVRSSDDRAALDALGKAESLKTVPLPFPPPAAWSTGDRIGKWLRLLTGRSSLLPRWIDGAAIDALKPHLDADTTIIADTLWALPLIRACGRDADLLSTHNIEHRVLEMGLPFVRGVAARGLAREADLLRRFEIEAFRRARTVIACSEDDAAFIRTVAPGRNAITINNGVDVPALAMLPPPDPNGHLLFVGSYDYPPNIRAAETLVRRWLPVIRKRLPHARVVLAGRDPQGAVRGLASDLVTVTGTVDDLRPWYEGAFACVMPIAEGGGSRIKILESFALGRPVISTKVGASGLRVTNGVCLAILEDAEAAADKLVQWRDHPNDLAAKLLRARAFVTNNHDWNRLRSHFAFAVTTLKG